MMENLVVRMSITSLPFRVTFTFLSFAFYTHFRTTCIIPLSQFTHVHFCNFALSHFINSRRIVRIRIGGRGSELLFQLGLQVAVGLGRADTSEQLHLHNAESRTVSARKKF